MPQSIQSLTWTPYQNSLIAQVTLDSATAQDWVVPIQGIYNQNIRTADGVIIDNTQNNANVDIMAGQLAVTVVPFVRDFLLLPNNVGASIDVSLTVGEITLTFYIGAPPVGAITNQAGASALANPSLFVGGLTTGAANAQTLSVAANYSFSQSVVISATAGLTNTGPATININQLGLVPINKVTSEGSVPLTGGELQANANFLLAANTELGVFDLVSSAPMQPRVAASVVFSATGGLINVIKAFNVAGVVRNAQGDYTASFTNKLPDGNYSFALTGVYLLSGGSLGFIGAPYKQANTNASMRIGAANAGGTSEDFDLISLTVFE